MYFVVGSVCFLLGFIAFPIFVCTALEWVFRKVEQW
jgi:hypothetical protein